MATPEPARGRDYGGAVTARVVRSAFDSGARLAYLQSSPIGRSVDERLGFRTVELWRKWVPAEYATAH